MKLVKTIAATGVGYLCAALDTDGQRLFVGGTDFHIHTYTLPTITPAEAKPLKGHASYVTALAYLPASKQLVSGSLDKSLIWWRAGAEMVRKVDAGQRINRLVASMDGALIAAACGDGMGRSWEADTGKLIAVLRDG